MRAVLSVSIWLLQSLRASNSVAGLLMSLKSWAASVSTT